MTANSVSSASLTPVNFKMKKILTFLCSGSFATAQTPASGVSENQNFAVFNGATPEAAQLTDYDGKIVMVMFMTPWCPTCTTEARNVGSNIAKHFKDNGGVNANGVPVVSLLLSTETAGGSSDSTTQSIASLNGYDFAGLDSKANRTEPREALGYFRGAAATPWPVSDRRRLVVINSAANTNEPQWQILHSEQFSNSQTVRNIIDEISVTLPPTGTTFAAWATENSLTAGENGPLDDPDGDGAENALEFSAGTDPLSGALFPTYDLKQITTGFTLTYTRLVSAINLTRTWQTGPLDAVTIEYILSAEDMVTAPTTDEDVEKVTVALPPDFGPFIRLKVGVE